MILKQIYIYPDLVEFPIKVTGPYRDRSRFFCNFIERELKLLKYDALGFTKICLVGSKKRVEPSLNSSGALTIPFEFDERKYSIMVDGDFGKYFSDLFVSVISGYDGSYPIPRSELVAAAQKFKAMGYINEWVIKEKKIPNKLRVTLKGRLNSEKFSLLLVIDGSNKDIEVREILTTPPDELYFNGSSYVINCVDGVISVANKFNETIYLGHIE